MTDRSRLAAVGLALALLASGLAGCLGATGEEEFVSLDDARQQVGTEMAPEEDLPIRLGLIEPSGTSDVPQGQHNVTFVLWNEETDEPVTDADVAIEAFMPMMGHGTEPETDPTHLAHGVHRGSTNLMMGGHWIVHLNATLASGDQASFPLGLDVAGGDGMDMDDGQDEGPSTSYESYEEASEAEGETFAPDANTTIRLKLLAPETREGLDTGETNITVLFFDEEADEPVTDGEASLEAQMPAMGHGTEPERDPTHAGHGVWNGMTTFAMNGTWVLHLGLETDDESLAWEIEVQVGPPADDDEEGPAFEPYEEVFEDQLTANPDYTRSWDATVEGPSATVTMNGSLQDATPGTDEVTVSLLDPDGDELGSFTLDADTSDSTLVVEDAPAGDHEVAVEGQGLDVSYRIVLQITPS